MAEASEFNIGAQLGFAKHDHKIILLLYILKRSVPFLVKVFSDIPN